MRECDEQHQADADESDLRLVGNNGSAAYDQRTHNNEQRPDKRLHAVERGKYFAPDRRRLIAIYGLYAKPRRSLDEIYHDQSAEPQSERKVTHED